VLRVSEKGERDVKITTASDVYKQLKNWNLLFRQRLCGQPMSECGNLATGSNEKLSSMPPVGENAVLVIT